MALTRWQLLREIILRESSGTLTAQTGRDYLYWCLESGKLLCVISSVPEHSFTNLVLQQTEFVREHLLRAQACIDESRTFGAVLYHRKLVTHEELRRLLFQHYCMLSYFLFLSGTHVFWSSSQVQLKPDLIRFDVPFSELLLSIERSSIEASDAIRVVQAVTGPYRILNSEKLEPLLEEKERRILQYVKAGCTLKEMFRDAELDRMVCYRTLFLFWLTGHLQDATSRHTNPQPKQRYRLPSWIRMFPPDWIFPLVGGVIIGVLLAPADPPSQQSMPTPVQTWRDPENLPPAWQEKKVNHEGTETRSED